MVRLRAAMLAAAVVILAGPVRLEAAWHTPLSWQQVVVGHPRPDLNGQLKNTSWIRDLNRNFVDDLIDSLFAPDDTVEIVVDFNQCLPAETIHSQLARFGRVTYIAKLISCAYVEGVRVRRLDSLAVRPDVAMIEWQTPSFTLNDVATRAVQARKSTEYAGLSAEDVLPSGLTGSGVRIAIVDTGVKDSHAAFSGAFVACFNATIFEDGDGDNIDDSCGGTPAGCVDPDDEAGTGATNPEPEFAADHGTGVAGIALGRAGPTGSACRTPAGITPDCVGVAPGATLVDVKACTGNTSCTDEDVMEAVDWIGLNASSPTMGVQVANLSIGDCTDDDGTSAEAEAVSYLAAIGIIPVVGHGNAGYCTVGGSKEAPGAVRTGSPGSASFAITVGAVDDHSTISRSLDDSHYRDYLQGPRKDYVSAVATPMALKPDLVAPGQKVVTAALSGTDKYFEQYGTSFATPFVAGAAALVRQAKPTITPGSVKDLFRTTADRSLTGFASGGSWDAAYGAGELNAGAAAWSAATTDVTFPHCVGSATTTGGPCDVSPLDSWNNYLDIRTQSPPQANVANHIYADIKNAGGASAAVTVSFGVYDFVEYTPVFKHIGSQTQTISSGTTWTADQSWTPSANSHQCVQVSVDFALDSNFGNNVTQRNLDVAASRYTFLVQNPYPTTADVRVVASSTRANWPCTVDPPQFSVEPAAGCPQKVNVTFDPPANAQRGEEADCRLAVYAKASGAVDSSLVGGVTVRTVVPKPCKLRGVLVDRRGVKIAKARVRFRRLEAHGQSAHGEGGRAAITDSGGKFQVELPSYVPHEITVETEGRGSGTMQLKWWCGDAPLTFEVGEKSLRVVRVE